MKNEELIQIAAKARKNALTDISNYAVGAALLSKSGTVYLGANIEDSTIPAMSVCAERCAIQNAISMGERKFDSIAIVGGNINIDKLDETIVPCGQCLQYINDMCKDINIITISKEGVVSNKLEHYLNIPYVLK
ncbi:MAG: cytidine deaminase [Clostridia bacterium]